MSTINSLRGRAVLMIAHVAGMIDMVALPIWVGTLIQHYKFNAQQAGGLVTLFLVGVVLASVSLAPRFDRLPRRWMATMGYTITGVAFFAASRVTAFGPLALLHIAGGLGLGCGLSFTHGTIGRSANPHRLFALAQFAVGVFAVLFFGGAPKLIAENGGQVLFLVFAVVMLIAVVVTAIGFPVDEARSAKVQAQQAATRIPTAAWFAIIGVLLLTLNQAMMFSFVERIGVDSGFGQDRVNTVLVIVGLVTLFPALIAAALQGRISTRTVGIIAALAQAGLALTITQTHTFELYAGAASLYVFVMLFSHTFLFGLIARLDPSGRAVASTPAMVMSGSAIGPFLGGTLVVGFGFTAIGIAVMVIAAIVVLCIMRIVESNDEARTTAVAY